MLRKLAGWVVLCTAACLRSGAQTAVAIDDKGRIDRLNAVASSYSKDNAFMGTVLVAEGDRVLLNKGYGMASLEWGVPNTPDVRFRVGSISKQFTAVLILLLQQDGKLNIDDPVSKYLPDAPKTWEEITLAELLGHTSGIVDMFTLKGFEEWSSCPHTPAESLAFFRDKPLDFAPGSNWSYSNSGYLVLGMVIEKVSGKKYEEVLKERILKPLALTNTGEDSDELVLAKRAGQYAPGENGLEVVTSGSLTTAWTETLYSTTGDLLKWERALFGGKVLSAESLQRMMTPGKRGYGLAVWVSERDGFRVVDHGGQLGGFKASLTYVPEKQLAVIVLGNVFDAAVDKISGQALDVAMGKPVVLAREQKALPIKKGELADFLGVYEISHEFYIAIAENKDGLTSRVARHPVMPVSPLVYLGLVQGHPRFLSPIYGSEFEFVPDTSGVYSSMVYHEGWTEFTAKKSRTQ